MCERPKININPDVDTIKQIVDSPRGVRDIYREQRIARTIYEMNIGDYVNGTSEIRKYEVGPIFSTAKKIRKATDTANKETNEWFRQNGGV